MTNTQWYLITWGLVGAVWALGALYNTFLGPRAVERRTTLSGLNWSIGLALYLLAARVLPGNLRAPISFQSPWLWTAGLILLLFSTLFVLWARWVLGTLWASTAMVKQGHRLRTSGPYRVTRHPNYTGLLGMAVGTMLMNGLGISLPGVLIMLAFFEIKIHSEEALLSQTFGEQYKEYKRRVPQLVPGTSLFSKRT